MEITTDTRERLTPLSKEDFVTAISKVRSIQSEDVVRPEDITDLSRVNERQLFASLVYGALKQRSVDVADKFMAKLPNIVGNLSEKTEGSAILIRATRRALRQLIKAGEISRKAAREVRRFALGVSQLDSDRTRLSESRLNEAPDDTPLRTVKTAFEKHLVSPVALKEEHSAFKANMRSEILEPAVEKAD